MILNTNKIKYVRDGLYISNIAQKMSIAGSSNNRLDMPSSDMDSTILFLLEKIIDICKRRLRLLPMWRMSRAIDANSSDLRNMLL